MWGCCRSDPSGGFSTAAGAIAFVLETTHGGSEVSDVGCVSEGGGRLEIGELGIMIGCVGAE